MTASLDEVLAGVAREHREDYSEHCCFWHDGCTCGWGEGGGESNETYAAHLAAEQSRAVADWLRSEDVREVAARADAVARRGVTARVNDTDRGGAAAALDAVAGLCGGEG